MTDLGYLCIMKRNGMEFDGLKPATGSGKKLYMETYGCQMNVGDTEIVVSLMQGEGYVHTDNIAEADVILVNTCSVRDNAEQRVWGRLSEFKKYKDSRKGVVVGVIGCMAERLKEELMERERIVDIVAGPDSYRDLPRLVRSAADGARSVNVHLSREETYAEISPVRMDRNGVSAFISIMRGCDNMCSYCIVPFTRGRERSRDPQTIVSEARGLFTEGYREVTLLGQNVNSYAWKTPEGGTIDFPTLLKLVASVNPLLRVRFATSHPKDLSDKVLEIMSCMPNICRCIHLPAQSGSNRMLRLMNRKYTREWYMERVAAIRRLIPDCAVTTDLMTGFCGETEDDHLDTLSLMRSVGYDFAYMFKYSERPGTKAAESMPDDVPDGVKTARLTEIINLQNELSLAGNRRDVGKRFEVLAEGVSKKRADQMFGRTSQNKVVIFDGAGHREGEYLCVEITDCTSATLIGKVMGA
ncbi:cdk5 regulatory subunit-associated protein 1 [Holotrichia oblita]|uniref:Cdk5 regulatory subunit-associated protein 1 n=1 Tax=Holotrichia oblita TaxID=644536 RepID=A0ACB9TR95_HOLOL|nr:cdk5 regulatory subunit-associated protein 1 [Holotrichia oblita]